MYIPLVVFILMLIFPALTKSGAYTGLILWLYTIIPTLLPYMIISGIICYFNAFTIISNLLYPITKRIFGISKNANYCLIVGFLCGYPMGSKVIADMLNKNELNLNEANYLLCFCNNISPSFIINYVTASILCNCYNINDATLKSIILILFISPMLVSIIYRIIHKQFNFATTYTTRLQTTAINDYNFMDRCILNSFENIFKIGGYIIIFTIISTWIQNISIFSKNTSFIISSLFEITSGLNSLKYTNFNNNIGILNVIFLCSFGGICSIAQTLSMISNTKLDIKEYIIYKVINGITAILMALIVL